MAVPRARTAPVALRRVQERLARDALLRRRVRHEEAALDLELVVEQRGEVVEEELPRHDAPVLPADGGPRRDPPGLQVGRDDHDVLEAERVADADADALHDRVRARVRRQARRHREQLLERESVARGLGGLLRRLHGERGVVGERDEDVELLVGRAEAAHRLVDGEDADEVAVVMAHRHEERVEWMPRVGADARRVIGEIEVAAVLRPVELAGRHEVRPSLAETVGEQRLPVLDPAHEPDEDRLRLGTAVHRRALEVVPLRTVEVDRDGLVAERLGDDAGDRTEERREVVGRPNEPRDLEEATQRRDRWQIRRRQLQTLQAVIGTKGA